MCHTTPARRSPGPGRARGFVFAHGGQVGHAAGPHRLLHGHVHRVELVVAREDLVEGPVVRVLLKGHEVMDQVEEAVPVEHAAHQHVQFQRRGGRVRLAVHGPPHLEPLLLRRQRPDTRLQAVRDHQHRVVMHQRGDLGLVGLQLRVRAPDGRVLVRGVLQLDQPQRQAVHEDHHVGPSVVLPLHHRELVHGQPVVGGRVVAVHQAGVVPRDAAVRPAVLHRHAVAHHGMEDPVGLDEGGGGHPQHLPQGLLPRLRRDGRVQPADGVPQPPHQHHVPERVPLRPRFPRRQLGTVRDGVAQLLKPGEGGFLDYGLGEAQEWNRSLKYALISLSGISCDELPLRA